MFAESGLKQPAVQLSGDEFRQPQKQIVLRTRLSDARAGQSGGSGRFARAEMDRRANAAFFSLKCRRGGKVNLHTLFKFSPILQRELAAWSAGGDNGPSGFIRRDQGESDAHAGAPGTQPGTFLIGSKRWGAAASR